jgi:hypothetical protein
MPKKEARKARLIVGGLELRPTAPPQTFAAQLGSQFGFVVALLEKEVQRVFNHGAFAHALKEGEPLETVGKIDVERVRDLGNATFVAVGCGRERNAFREPACRRTPLSAGGFLGFHVSYDVRLAIEASYHVLFSVRKELIEKP